MTNSDSLLNVFQQVLDVSLALREEMLAQKLVQPELDRLRAENERLRAAIHDVRAVLTEPCPSECSLLGLDTYRDSYIHLAKVAGLAREIAVEEDDRIEAVENGQ